MIIFGGTIYSIQLRIYVTGYLQVPVPWKRLSRVENRTYELEQSLKDINEGKDEAKTMIESLGDTNKYLKEAQGAADQAKFVFDRVNKSIDTVEQCIKDGEDVQKIMRTSYGKAWGIDIV